MIEPRQAAAALLGEIDWQSEVSGLCRCPGESLHTHPTGKKDCRVNVDGAPTIFCFHASCAVAVAAVNLQLRKQIGGSPWEISLPGGRVLRSGDVLQSSGAVLPREVVQARAKTEGRDAGEQLVLETLKALAERFKPELFETFRWPFAQIIEDSPLQVSHRDADDQFRTWLKLWPAHSTVWIGDIYSSGKPEHKTNFRPVADWYQIGPVMGNFTCGSAFKPGSFQRSNANCDGTRFMVVESDTLPKDEVGAIFAYLNRRLHFNLHAIIDTAGKSLHGWFDAPRTPRIEAQLKAMLTVFGCDPKLFTYSQPVRVPGAYRDGRLQRIVWVRDALAN
jgi:hypothetical protein